MNVQRKPSIDEKDYFSLFSSAELERRGLSVDELKKDSFQAHPRSDQGYLGLLVANFLARQSQQKREEMPFVSAYLVAEGVGAPFESITQLRTEGRPVVEEREIEGVADLYVNVADVHGCVVNSTFESLTALATAYAGTRNPLYRDRITRESQTMVTHAVKKIKGLPSYVDLEDLIQDGNLGLLDAVEKYDPDEKIKFETYAPQRIRGAILDGLRAVDHISRLDRTRLRELRAFEATFKEQKGTIPERDDLLAEWGRRGLPSDKFNDFYYGVWTKGEHVSSLNATKYTNGDGRARATLGDTARAHANEGPVAQVKAREILEKFERDLLRVPEKYREPLQRILLDGITLKEASEEMNPPMSESRLSQVVTLYVRSGSFFQHTRAYLGDQAIRIRL
jgi:RNA polymerase sigma factor for flagellar operon FliA